MGFFKTILLVAGICCLCLSASARGQEARGIDGYVGHGIAQISGGDMPGARAAALADAQLKAVIDGAFSLMPGAAAAPQAARLFSRFAEGPERYMQSFSIVSERALPDQYQVCLQATLDMEGLRRELAAMGLVKKAAAASVVLLVMAAERGLDAELDSFWWSPAAGTAREKFPLQLALEAAFADSETRILSPFDPPLQELFRPLGMQPEPDAAAVVPLARQTSAQMVMLVRSTLKRVTGKPLASLHNVQCDISARAIDLRRQEVVAQSVTCGLGVHVDEAEAAREAMQKASRQLADQITDRLYQQLRQVREYVFKLRFNKGVAEADVRDCVAAFKQVLPGLELVEILPDDGKERWTARVTSPADDAATLQKMFGAGVAGYITKITSAQDNVLTLRVTPIKR
jgi:hypothetical protein